jgi:hypothetical protein
VCEGLEQDMNMVEGLSCCYDVMLIGSEPRLAKNPPGGLVSLRATPIGTLSRIAPSSLEVIEYGVFSFLIQVNL